MSANPDAVLNAAQAAGHPSSWKPPIVGQKRSVPDTHGLHPGSNGLDEKLLNAGQPLGSGSGPKHPATDPRTAVRIKFHEGAIAQQDVHHFFKQQWFQFGLHDKPHISSNTFSTPKRASAIRIKSKSCQCALTASYRKTPNNVRICAYPCGAPEGTPGIKVLSKEEQEMVLKKARGTRTYLSPALQEFIKSNAAECQFSGTRIAARARSANVKGAKEVNIRRYRMEMKRLREESVQAPIMAGPSPAAIHPAAWWGPPPPPPTTRMIVVCSVCVYTPDGKVLMGLHTHAPVGNGTFAFPGGKLKLGESFVSCAIRQLREDTGLAVRGLERVIPLQAQQVATMDSGAPPSPQQPQLMDGLPDLDPNKDVLSELKQGEPPMQLHENVWDPTGKIIKRRKTDTVMPGEPEQLVARGHDLGVGGGLHNDYWLAKFDTCVTVPLQGQGIQLVVPIITVPAPLSQFPRPMEPNAPKWEYRHWDKLPKPLFPTIQYLKDMGWVPPPLRKNRELGKVVGDKAVADAAALAASVQKNTVVPQDMQKKK